MKYLSIKNELDYSKKRYEFTKEIESIFIKNNYIQIKPSIFEDYDNFISINKRTPTKSMVKIVSDKILVLRPDITTNIIKSLIPRWEDNLVLKLFYDSTVYKNEGKEGIKEIRQFGCEYLGEKSIDSDIEIVNMSLDILAKFGEKFILEIGNSNYINGLLNELNLKEAKLNKLKSLILRKNKIEINNFIEKLSITKELKETLLNIFQLNGGIDEVILKANKFYTNDLMKKGLKELGDISNLLKDKDLQKYINCDLSMMGKFDYYEGIMLKGYYSNIYKEILSGGRYDALTEEFGRRVPAIGFCIDVDGLMKAARKQEEFKINNIVIAIAKGRIEKDVYRRLKILNMEECIERDSRKLIFQDEKNKITYIHVKPSDVVTYVEKGVADLGIVGKDTVLENENDDEVYELLDLGFGKCKFSVAGVKDKNNYSKEEILKVATKYPTITKDYFKSRGQKIEIIKLNGSVELAPIVELSDVIVDLVETGNTLKANGLEIVEDMCNISSRIIANRVSYKFNKEKIEEIVNKFASTLDEKNY